MSTTLTLNEMTDVLDQIVTICWSIREGQEDPFAKLTSANRRTVAYAILASSASSGFVHLDEAATAILIWHRDANGRYHLEVAHLWDKCKKTIAEIHEYFRREGLMDQFSPASYQ